MLAQERDPLGVGELGVERRLGDGVGVDDAEDLAGRDLAQPDDVDVARGRHVGHRVVGLDGLAVDEPEAGPVPHDRRGLAAAGGRHVPAPVALGGQPHQRLPVLEVGELLEPAHVAEGEGLDHVGLGLGGGEAEADVEGEGGELRRRELLAAQVQGGSGDPVAGPARHAEHRDREGGREEQGQRELEQRGETSGDARAGRAGGHRTHGNTPRDGEKGCLVGEDSGITPVTPVTSQGVRDNYTRVIRGRSSSTKNTTPSRRPRFAILTPVTKRRGRQTAFDARVEQWRPDLEACLGRVYGADAAAGVADRLVALARAAHDARPDDLRALDERRLAEPDWFQRPAHDRLRRLRGPVRGHPGRRRPAGVVPRGPRRRLPAPDAAADPATRPERRRLRGAGLPLRARATWARSRTCAR